MSASNLVGQTFGEWIVVAEHDAEKQRRRRYVCSCVCGEERLVLAQNLLNGRSAGHQCLNKTFPFLPRNASKAICSTHARHSWYQMFHRCYNKSYDAYDRYGGAGVTVCERWFYLQNFLDDMGDSAIGMTVDRISPYGNYELDNCRWATRAEQNRNKKKHHFLSYNGERKLLVDWARTLNIPQGTLYNRVRAGWKEKDIISTPINTGKRNKKARTHAVS